MWLADCHLNADLVQSGSLWPKHMARLPEEQAKRLYRTISDETFRAFGTPLRYIANNGPWNFLGQLGDFVGGWLEQGCGHPEVQQVARAATAQLRAVAPDTVYAVGNHETGYKSPLTIAGAGFCWESLQACYQIFGQLFWKRELTNLVVVGVCSSLAEYAGTDPEVLKEKQEQSEFLHDTLVRLRGRKWILAAHKFATPKHFIREIQGYEKSLVAFVCGDLHDPFKHKLLKPVWSLHPNATIRAVMKRSVMCPSTAPLWWRGYGMLTMEWDAENDRLTTHRIELERPADSVVLPTESMFTCFRWMMPF